MSPILARDLDENDIDLATKLQLGALLAFDPNREEFVGNSEANRLLTREYRKPFEVPTTDAL